jgi:hypothetical protein
LAEQTADYNTIKAKRDELKAEYDGLVAADDAGTIDEGGISRLVELDVLYYDKDFEYTEAKTALE